MQASRILSAFFMALCALALVACAGGKPETTVETFYRAAAKGDVETATQQISFAQFSAGEMTQAKGKVTMIVGEMQSKVDANDGIDAIEILESSIAEDGKTASVRTKLTFNNGKEITENHRLAKDDGDWKIVLK